jgi:hypothetical protein
MKLAGTVLAFSALLIVGGAGCGGHSSGQRERDLPRGNFASLTVSYSRIPALPVKHFVTRGVYPRVSSRGMDLRAVNAALLNAVLDDERRFRREMEHEESQILPKKWRWHDRAIYQTWTPRPSSWGSPRGTISISASPVVVSALFSEWPQPPRANADSWFTFLSVTVRVPSGSPVTIVDLFAEPSQGLRALATAVRRQFSSDRPRIFPRSFYRSGLAPKASNYRLFALTTRGLVIAFHAGAIAHPIAGPLKTTVPYAILRPYLSKLGQKLIAGVRRPRFTDHSSNSG